MAVPVSAALSKLKFRISSSESEKAKKLSIGGYPRIKTNAIILITMNLKMNQKTDSLLLMH